MTQEHIISRPAELDDGTPVEHRKVHGAGIILVVGLTALTALAIWIGGWALPAVWGML